MAPLCRQSDGSLDGLRVSAQPPVPCGSKSLQVNVGGVDQGQQCPPGTLLNGAVGDQNVDHPLFMDQFSTVPNVLVAHQRLVVGVGHADIPMGAQF